eukprot:365263-Chlamydomonas_euryale.AAC.18
MSTYPPELREGPAPAPGRRSTDETRNVTHTGASEGEEAGARAWRQRLRAMPELREGGELPSYTPRPRQMLPAQHALPPTAPLLPCRRAGDVRAGHPHTEPRRRQHLLQQALRVRRG